MVGSIWYSEGYVGFYCNTTDVGYGPVLKFNGDSFDDSLYFMDLFDKIMNSGKTSSSRLSIILGNRTTDLRRLSENHFDLVKKIYYEYQKDLTEPKDNDNEDTWDFWVNEWDWGIGFYCKKTMKSFGPVMYSTPVTNRADTVKTKKELKDKWERLHGTTDPRLISADNFESDDKLYEMFQEMF